MIKPSRRGEMVPFDPEVCARPGKPLQAHRVGPVAMPDCLFANGSSSAAPSVQIHSHDSPRYESTSLIPLHRRKPVSTAEVDSGFRRKSEERASVESSDGFLAVAVFAVLCSETSAKGKNCELKMPEPLPPLCSKSLASAGQSERCCPVPPVLSGPDQARFCPPGSRTDATVIVSNTHP